MLKFVVKKAVGKIQPRLLKGCKVHWHRSCQHVAEKVLSTEERGREKKVFLQIASKIQTLDSSIGTIACFEALCRVQRVAKLLKIIPTLHKADEAKFIDKKCN